MSASEQSTAFAASGQEAIARSIDIAANMSARRPESLSIGAFYEIDRTVEIITKRDFHRIALQFPDELLHDAVPVYHELKRSVGEGRDLYMLADTSYGNCCVDEVAAQHVDADMIVHYGHACMTKLPVAYVFGRKPINVEDCLRELKKILQGTSDQNETATKPILIRHDVGYTYRMNEIVARLRDETDLTIIHNEILTWVEPEPSSNDEAKTDIKTNETENIILYIGGESLALTNLLITYSSNPFYSHDPITGSSRFESRRANRLLMRRFAAVQKARDADVFGILVGTLGVFSYLPLISHLRKILAKALKKSYTISIGKLNPAKLANFMEIECFVLAACPENSVIESKEFYRPIITPYELEIALQTEGAWSGRYVLDFDRLLAEHGFGSDSLDEEDRDPDQPTFSLVTGRYRHARRFDAPESFDGDTSSLNSVVLRNRDGTIAVLPESAAAVYLQSRTFRGLDARVGEDMPSILEQGRSGIARGYTDDHPNVDVPSPT